MSEGGIPRHDPANPGDPIDPAEPSARSRLFRMSSLRIPKIAQAPTPQLRLRLRSKLVVAMLLAALVPVAIVALLATGVILSSLEGGLREDADRQLTVGLNLVLRAVERLGDESVQLSESFELGAALERNDMPAIEAWLSHEQVHLPSSRLQLVDASGTMLLDRTVGGAVARFADVGVRPDDPVIAAGRAWTRGVSLVTVGDRVVVRAVSPVVDPSLTLRGVLVLSTPFDGDFADAIKGALSADVMLGGPSGTLQVTFRSSLGRRGDPMSLGARDRAAALRGQRVIRDLDLERDGEEPGHYKVAVTGLLDGQDRPVGLIAVAVDREPLAATKRLALRTLVAGGLAALAFALVLALFWSRRLGAPIAQLHRGAIAVSRGDLDHRIDIAGGDELTDLATAFNQMTSTLKDNQARLAARMREIVALHDAGRAVSSVIDLDSVSRKIVDAVARTFDVQLVALWLVEGGASTSLRASAARARRADMSTALAMDEALAAAGSLRDIAEQVRKSRTPLRFDRASSDPVHGEAARLAGAPGPLVALPLDRNRPGAAARVVGVLAVGRAEDAREFSEADLNLLTTFADQAGAAVENALLYQEVRGASEELERKVRLRTAELTAINHELGKAFADLRETQAQLILSERMAGLGVLVAGVAHEINSPTAAIRGSIEGLSKTLVRVSRHGAELAAHAPTPATAGAITDYLEEAAPKLSERQLPTGLTARKAARELAVVLESAQLADAPQLAADLADLGATLEDAERFIGALGPHRQLAREVVASLTDHVYLHRTASTVRHAVGQIQRIVGALKTYSHLDQQATRIEADLHEGLETTLAVLHHTLRDIVVERHYGDLPRVPVYVDELNQVWTNLISNAQQAVSGRAQPGAGNESRPLHLGPGGSITIETAVDAEGKVAIVRVIDDGPGVPEDVLPRIFEPFFTTKPKGEGTGLGLGIARQIVDKHGGELHCQSEPGRTVFEVRLPIVTSVGVAT
ncbi:MAG: HAMP domain-containing protein [Deltaproteobacteria bacterium]|nr:HAMP domain-containing protein [Deltaproteobacteria bacterium]